MKGIIWYHKGVHYGSKKRYKAYASKHPEAKVVLELETNSREQLELIVANIQRSNMLSGFSQPTMSGH